MWDAPLTTAASPESIGRGDLGALGTIADARPGARRRPVPGRGAQRDHVGLAIRRSCGCSITPRHLGDWYEAEARIVRDVVRAYLASSLYGLP